jgi:hypothetical protein
MSVFGLEVTQEFLITFLFTLAVVFGVLEVANIFKNKPINVVIAMAIAFFASTYAPFTSMLWSYLPTMTWFFIALFFVAFLAEILGLRKKEKRDYMETSIIHGFIFFVLLAVGWMVKDIFYFELPIFGGPDNVILLLGIIFILSLFWNAWKAGQNWISKEEVVKEMSRK